MFLALSIVACDTDDSNADSELTEVSAFGSSGSSNCIELVYPVSFEFPDGSIVAVDSKDALKESVAAYKETNDVRRVNVDLVFPVQVLDSLGTVLDVATLEELEALKAECKSGRTRGGKRTKCIDIQFPLSYILVDGTEITGESYQEIKTAVKEWKELNPNTRPEAMLIFPISIIDAEGNTITVEDSDALAALEEECEDDEGDDGRTNQRGSRGNR